MRLITIRHPWQPRYTQGEYEMKWVCVFRDRFLREQVTPRILAEDPKAPIGAFQKAFREEHCRQLDVYGTGSCPYKREECALAYLQVAMKTIHEARTSKVGLFRKIARSYGAERADNKPLARSTIRTNGQKEDAHRAVERDDEARWERMRTSGPRSIGSLFGPDDG
jgi:hypothetical protein